jgi:hypothetical protein
MLTHSQLKEAFEANQTRQAMLEEQAYQCWCTQQGIVLFEALDRTAITNLYNSIDKLSGALGQHKSKLPSISTMIQQAETTLASIARGETKGAKAQKYIQDLSANYASLVSFFENDLPILFKSTDFATLKDAFESGTDTDTTTTALRADDKGVLKDRVISAFINSLTKEETGWWKRIKAAVSNWFNGNDLATELATNFTPAELGNLSRQIKGSVPPPQQVVQQQQPAPVATPDVFVSKDKVWKSTAALEAAIEQIKDDGKGNISLQALKKAVNNVLDQLVGQ